MKCKFLIASGGIHPALYGLLAFVFLIPASIYYLYDMMVKKAKEKVGQLGPPAYEAGLAPENSLPMHPIPPDYNSLFQLPSEEHLPEYEVAPTTTYTT